MNGVTTLTCIKIYLSVVSDCKKSFQINIRRICSIQTIFVIYFLELGFDKNSYCSTSNSREFFFLPNSVVSHLRWVGRCEPSSTTHLRSLGNNYYKRKLSTFDRLLFLNVFSMTSLRVINLRTSNYCLKFSSFDCFVGVK